MFSLLTITLPFTNTKVQSDDESDSSSEEDSDDSSSDSDEEESTEESSEEEVKTEAPSKKRKAEEEPEAASKKTKTEEGSEESATLWVGNLGWGVDDNILYEHFKSFEPVGARVVTDKESGRSRGFGYVDFGDHQAAKKAFDANQGAELEGRELRLDFSGKPPASNGNDRSNDRAKKYGDTISPESDTLFVGNLSFNVNEDSVSEFFNSVAKVQSLRLPTDQ